MSDINTDLAAAVPHGQAVVHQLTVLGIDVLSGWQACTSGLKGLSVPHVARQPGQDLH